MICRVTEAVIRQQNLAAENIGRWLAVIEGIFFLFDTEDEARGMRAHIRRFGVCNKWEC